MKVQLLVNLCVCRECFLMEDFIGSDDIFALVKSGSFCFESKDGSYTVCENEAALFRKNVLYHRRVLEPVTLYLFRFQSDTPLFLQDKIVFSDTCRIKSSIEQLEQLDRGILKDEFSHRCAIFNAIVTQYAIENAAGFSGLKRRDLPIEKAISDISENLHKKLSLEHIAAESGISYVQFIRRFKQYTGMTPSDYVTLLRLQKSKQLLTDTALPIKEVACLCGFENEYYFSNFFKKHTDMSPSAFRKLSI